MVYLRSYRFEQVSTGSARPSQIAAEDYTSQEPVLRHAVTTTVLLREVKKFIWSQEFDL